MKKYLNMPKVKTIGILLLFFIVASSLIGLQIALFLVITCVGFAFLLDIIFTYIRRREFFKPFAAIVTGLILALIIDPSASWYQIFVICAAAMAIKNFARIGNRHIFNPAASGLLAGWVLFGLNPSWWGATLHRGDIGMVLNLLVYLLLLAIAYVSCYKLGRYNTVISYILIYAVLFLFVTSSWSLQAFVKTIVSPGILFYALLMLPEPMTSPVNRRRQLMYGATIAIISAFLVYLTFKLGVTNIPDSSIVALLIGNFLFFRFRG